MNGFIEGNYCTLLLRFLIFHIISPILLALSYMSLLASSIIFWDILIPECMKDLWVWIQIHRFLMILIMVNIIFYLTLCFRTKPGSPSTDKKKYMLSKKEISLIFSNIKVGDNNNCNNNHNNNTSSSSSNNSNASSTSTSSMNTTSSSNINTYINNSVGRIIDNRYQLFIKPGVYYEYCPHCRVMRPPRAKHCNILNKCIYHYEYYSPWIYNSIGINNYRYYLLWLFWMCVGSFYAACLTCLLISDMPFEWMNLAIEFMFQPNLPFIIFFFGVITTISAVFFTCMLSYHIKLVYSNLTSSEYFGTGSQGTITLLGSISPLLAQLCRKRVITNNVKSSHINNSNIINSTSSVSNNNSSSSIKNPYDCGWRKNIKRILGDDIGTLAMIFKHTVPSFSRPTQPEYKPSMTMQEISYLLKDNNSDHLCDTTYSDSYSSKV